MRSKQRTKSGGSPSRTKRSFVDDHRAIEGLPIRLVIALIVGVMSLGIMLQILGGIGTFEGDTEVDVAFQNDTVEVGGNDNKFTVSVVDEEGNEVNDATLVAKPGTAHMDDAIVEGTGSDDNSVTFDFTNENLELPPDQHTGTIEFDVKPPTGTNWADDEPNDELLVVD
ncbi:DUF7382 domain-containing protein [Halopiger djelfimassiliensis]|uniref:DUF7382 domain-containing protein n=1 Tax=Halopiger djelfimassiliensis TaxID=1293047 RepID=UPI000677619E|nr:hypothetical protein [Halopiger djelfimassiliensis]